jgi:hypothetical protein
MPSRVGPISGLVTRLETSQKNLEALYIRNFPPQRTNDR